jgi:hypothetical protein
MMMTHTYAPHIGGVGRSEYRRRDIRYDQPNSDGVAVRCDNWPSIEPMAKPIPQGCTTERAREDADEADPDLDGRKKPARVLDQLHRDPSAPTARVGELPL